MAKKYTMHVVAGTHWDREWRHSAEQSKLRLRDLIDHALDLLETRESYKAFVIDGGQVTIDDYISVRPENRDRLRRLCRAGRIQLVNWYTLPDNNIVPGEAIIRNIMLGRKVAEEFGGTIQTGYTATSYGQPSQLPQMYQGCGIPSALFYRGLNKHVGPTFFEWEGKDGTRIYVHKGFDEATRNNWFFYVYQRLVLDRDPRIVPRKYRLDNIPVHFADNSLYERALFLLRENLDFARDTDTLKKAVEQIKQQTLPYAVGNHLLGLSLEDNEKPYELLPDMIDALNGVSDEIEFKFDTIDDYFQTLMQEAGEDIYVHKGECRFTAVESGFNGLLGSSQSSRVKMKLLSERAETWLINFAEPFATFASYYGLEYPRTNLDIAWQYLLQNHAHDSICGAAVDRAHEEMLYRFSLARTVGEEVTARSIVKLFDNINTAADFKPGDHTITLFNATNTDRRGVYELRIDLPNRESIDTESWIGEIDDIIRCFDIVDASGQKIPFEVLSRENIQIEFETEGDTSAAFLSSTRRRMLIEADVPALGYKTYALRMREPEYVPHPEPGPMRERIAREYGVLENEHVKVTIHPNGTFDLVHKSTGRRMEKLHYFTDDGEVGNAHQSNRPVRDFVETSLGSQARIRMVESNTLRGVFRIDLTLTVPAAATEDGRDRLREEKQIPITTWLTLTKDSEVLEIKTRLDNQARDHRLRVNFPTGIETDEVDVETNFAVDSRCFRWIQTGDNSEGHYAFHPMQNLLDLSDGDFGLGVFNKGMREYEVHDDKLRTISLTLLRTTRAYMTANKKMTPAEFDKYKGPHSIGEFEFEYALYPHKGDWQKAQALQKAYEFKVDVKALQGVPKEGQRPTEASFIRAEPTGKVMVSAVKQADDGKGTVVRLWNLTGENISSTLKLDLPITTARRLRLDETPQGDLKVKDSKIVFDLAPYKIETILLQ